MLVVLAAGENETDRRRALAADAERGLSLLERLEREGSPGPLGDLADWASDLGASDDPDVERLARAIQLRALVELAKLERESGGQ